MPTIKHVGNHTDQLHDGRPLPVEAVETISDADLKLEHYQSRIAAGTLIALKSQKSTTDQEGAS